MSITTPQELEGLQAAGAVVRRVLETMKSCVRRRGCAGYARARCARRPAMVYGFPRTNLISVNDEAVHGIPGDRVLEDGDLVKLDVTVEKDGFMADAAETVAVGHASDEALRLIACAERAFAKATLVARQGFRVFEIGRAVEREVRRDGFFVIRELGGHSIGRAIHEDPRVPNFSRSFSQADFDCRTSNNWWNLSLRPEPVMPCLDPTAGPCAPRTAAPPLIMSTRL